MKLPAGPRLPFVGLVLAAVAGILASDFWPLTSAADIAALILAGTCAAFLLRWPKLLLIYVFVAFTFFLRHSAQTIDTPGQRLAARLGERPRAVSVIGAVITEPKIAGTSAATFLLRLESIELEGHVEPINAPLLVRWRGNPVLGDKLKLFGMAEPMSAPRNPGEFDMRAYLMRRDVHRRLIVRYAEEGLLIRHGGGNPILIVAQKCRDQIQAVLCRDLNDAPDVQNLISGIALGLRHQTPEDIEEPFQQTGTLHLFAVAGLHVGIVAKLLWMLATVARLPRKWATAAIIPLLLFYAAVTGLHVSSVRAAVMSAFLFGGFFAERKVLSLNSLAAAAFFLLAWNTNEIFSTGFQLSFAVVGTIILWADPLARWFRSWSAPDPFLPRSLLRGPRRLADLVVSWVAQGSSISLAAWIGSLVLILWYFYLITPISLFANLVVVPIAFFLLAIALLSLISAPVLPWLSIVFNNANWCLARLVLGLVHLFAQIPGGHYYFEHPRWPDGARVKINVLDLGPGAAIHTHARGNDWLFDCGSERDYERIVRQYLHAAGVNKLRGLLLTHGDSLHIGGAVSVVSELRPAFLIDNPLPDRSIVHRRLRTLFLEQGLVTGRFTANESFHMGPDVTATILHPPRLCLADTADDQALVVQLKINGAPRILFMSDSGVATETALLRSGIDLHSDIIIKGQHHSDQSGSPLFLQAVHPQLIISTSRDFPESERITDEWAELVRSSGIKLFRQDETGAVQLHFRRDDWEARAYLTGETFRSSSR